MVYAADISDGWLQALADEVVANWSIDLQKQIHPEVVSSPCQ